MGFIFFLFLIGIFWVLPIIVIGRQGKRLGLNNAWMYGLFLGWFGYFILAMKAPKAITREGKRALADGTAAEQFAPFRKLLLGTEVQPNQRCPECAVAVQEAAKVCKHCGHRFEEAPSPPELA